MFRAAAPGGKGWSGQEDKEPEEKDISCWCSWRGGWDWLGRAAGSLTKAGQNDRPGASQIEKGCMSALKSLNNFLAHV